MAKPKTPPTAAQIAADKARETYAKAKETFKAKETDANKKALENAQAALRAAVEIENAERFKKVGESRTKAARAAIRNVGKVFNPKGYKFNKEQGEKIFAGIDEAVSAARKEFTNALSGSVSAKASDDFAL